MRELELYVHIPFCIKKCAYCDFLSGPAPREEQKAYADALMREIDRYRGKFEESIVTSIFFGGGTPSVLETKLMAGVISRIRDVFQIDPCAEITMEMNPGTVSKEKFLEWKEMGINRLSIGLQSARNEELQILGRIHTYEEFLCCFAMAREAGFSNINIDLISAVPGQTAESFEKTLRKVAELAPEHLSVYSLIIEEGTPFYEKYGAESAQNSDTLSLPDEEEDRRMYEMTGQILGKYGYLRYEISNYAKPGFECRHNLGYWERKDYLGIGTGASSLINNVRFSHIEDRSEYVRIITEDETDQALERISTEKEQLDLKAQMEEFMFLGLRKMEGISKKIFESTFKAEFDTVYGAVSKKMEAEGLLYICGDQVCLSKKGIDLSNQVFVEYLDPLWQQSE